MTSIRTSFLARLGLGLLILAGTSAPFAAPAVAQETTAQTPDNSAHNKHHNNTGEVADHQSDARSDVKTTAAIRRAIVADKSLSTYAHNVKIITRDGAVTLKGPVKSEDEKSKIAADAATAVSNDKITNQLTVKQ